MKDELVDGLFSFFGDQYACPIGMDQGLACQWWIR